MAYALQHSVTLSSALGCLKQYDWLAGEYWPMALACDLGWSIVPTLRNTRILAPATSVCNELIRHDCECRLHQFHTDALSGV